MTLRRSRYALLPPSTRGLPGRRPRVGSVSGAGEMSQSAVSGALGDLERQFGLQLFDRIGKRLRLSELGQSVRRPRACSTRRARGRVRGAPPWGGCGSARPSRSACLVAPLMARCARAQRRRALRFAVAYRGDRAAGGRLRDRRRPGRGRDQHPDLEVTPWRDDELVDLRARPPLREEARPHRRRSRGQVDRARAGLRHASDLRPRDARSPGGSRHRPRPRRRSAGPSRPASAWGASRASAGGVRPRHPRAPCRVPTQRCARRGRGLIAI